MRELGVKSSDGTSFYWFPHITGFDAMGTLIKARCSKNMAVMVRDMLWFCSGAWLMQPPCFQVYSGSRIYPRFQHGYVDG